MHYRSDVYADPQQKKQDSKTGENSRNKSYKEFFEDVSGRFRTRDFIYEEPSREEYPNAKQDDG